MIERVQSFSLEPPLETGRNAGEGGADPAMRLGNQAARSPEGGVTVGGDAVSAGTQIVVGVRSVHGRRDRGVPGQIRSELVLVSRSDHVCRIVILNCKQAAASAAVRAR